MNEHCTVAEPNACAPACASTWSVEVLNNECHCVGVDQRALHAELHAVLQGYGLPNTLAETHPHLFSALPVYVSHRHIEQMAGVVAATHEVSSLAAYQTAVLAWGPEIAGFDPGSPGGLLGLDFHLATDGPKLIEINTNPGGALLNAVLGRAHRACMPEWTIPPDDAARIEDAVLQSLLVEWRLQRGAAPLAMVAIVDESPSQQYLYPEFVLYRALFQQHGYRAEICSPHELIRKRGRLWLGDHAVDLVYNRLTDFALQQPAHDGLRAAYIAKEVAMTPHPRAHALYADKRNLSLLGNRLFLQMAGVSQDSTDALVAAVPATQLMTLENREAMWTNRRHMFFKPAAGFGSKASYRGDKITRRVWDAIADGVYVAQDIVAPSERLLASGSDPLKVDIRCYAYRGEALLYAARMYQGQTTNFRTPGGGFAPVLSRRTEGDGRSSPSNALQRAENEGWPPSIAPQAQPGTQQFEHFSA